MAAGPRRGELRDQRITGGLGEGAGLGERTGRDRLRAGHAELAAEVMQRVLTGQAPRQVGRRIREQERTPQVTAVFGEKDRTGVVGREQNAWLSDLVRENVQT